MRQFEVNVQWFLLRIVFMKGSIKIIGVPVDLGQTKRGVDMGPGAIRYAGLAKRLEMLGYEVNDLGNIRVPVRESIKEEMIFKELCSACERAYDIGKEAVDAGAIPIFLGGDHSISIGSVGGITHKAPAGVIWIDCHGDFNTPGTSVSGNIHGMALAVLAGMGIPELVDIGRPGAKLKPEDVVMISVRDLDDGEKKLLKQSGITIFTMRDIDEYGMSTVAFKALKHLEHHSTIHISLDMDSIDPSEAPGVGTPVPGGLTYREAHLLMEILADSGKCSSLDIVEINPLEDKNNRTANVAVELAVSLFGKKIL
jgi:arginase